MQKLLFVLLTSFTLIACSKSKGSSETPVTDDKPKGTVIATAKIIEGPVIGDKANGDAMIYNDNGTWKLYLSNFSSNNGPDLRVYLATSSSASSFINLGKLKATSGSQTYDIPGNPNLGNYKYVIVWCAQFAVYFGGGQWQ
jgi:Electron transfer DM13